MSDNNSSSSSGGIGFAGLLTLLFVFLKLNPGGNFTTPVADWSWWWVVSPLWISVLLVVVILVVALAVAFVLDKIYDRQRRKAYKARWDKLK